MINPKNSNISIQDILNYQSMDENELRNVLINVVNDLQEFKNQDNDDLGIIGSSYISKAFYLRELIKIYQSQRSNNE